MSSTPSEPGHALRPDGTQKDASDIDWTFDADEALPFPSGSTSTSSGRPEAVEATDGLHRTSRVSHPSRRVLDALNSDCAPSRMRTIKRKAPSDDAAPDRCVTRKVTIDVDGDAGGEDTISEPSTEPADDDYEAIKAMADADNEAATFKPPGERTADVRVIFRRDKEYIDPDTGKTIEGNWCMLCRGNPSVKKSSCFFVGGVSTLRTHIARYHAQLYRKRCLALKIKPHVRGLFHVPSEATSTDSLTQTSLKGVVSRQPKRPAAPAFTKTGLMDHVIELVICEDKAFRLVDQGTFCCLLQFCRPLLLDKDIPHRHLVRAEIIQHADLAEGLVRASLNKILSKVSFTFDAWTSAPGDPYLSLTAHYIDAPADHPNQWELKCEQLIFQEIQGRHTGKNMADILSRALDRYDLHGKIGWFTSDGAAVNWATLHALQNDPSTAAEWTAQAHDMLCMEHSLHLAAKHFVEVIAPHSSNNGATGSEDEDEPASDGGEDNDDDNEVFIAGDSLGKAIALIKQIRKSPQARAFFRATCTQVGIPPLELLLWIRTRWGSLFAFIERVIELKAAVNQFILLADASELVPNLTKKHCYADFHLSRRDLERLNAIGGVLMEPSNAQQTFSSEHSPTVWRIIPSFEFLILRWESMAKQLAYHGLKGALDEGVKSLRKWYDRSNSTSPAYFICLVLDPNVKDSYFWHRWDSTHYAAGMTQLEDAFDSYYVAPTQAVMTAESATPDNPSAPLFHYGGSFLLNSVQAIQHADVTLKGPHDELKQYLKSGAEPTQDIVAWWGINTRYPTLRWMV